MDRDRFAENLGVFAEDVVVNHVFIGMDVDVGKDQPGNHANDQRDGELLQKTDVVCSEQCAVLPVVSYLIKNACRRRMFRDYSIEVIKNIKALSSLGKRPSRRGSS